MSAKRPSSGASAAADPAVLPAAIRSLLACPKCRGALVDGSRGDSLVCRTCQLAYPVRDGIPIMLIDEAVAIVG